MSSEVVAPYACTSGVGVKVADPFGVATANAVSAANVEIMTVGVFDLAKVECGVDQHCPGRQCLLGRHQPEGYVQQLRYLPYRCRNHYLYQHQPDNSNQSPRRLVVVSLSRPVQPPGRDHARARDRRGALATPCYGGVANVRFVEFLAAHPASAGYRGHQERLALHRQ